ncbi:40s ribosomal protein s24 [Stylonychia lemnae]|uniref:40s ribosomal protein s24 n=1 Tax=Stylonychia lemnae TaxID=5949 RepID=A0A078B5G7_STYLE|nr:40s ribosomal protein s24 [Stylonychia lemnae]|eukprot:CDW89669.1 40s ribosomal protein s24 [Stylonychia lemnae]
MSDQKFILYARKFMKNPLLGRRQCVVELVHPEMANVPKAQIKTKLAALLKSKEEQIAIFGLKTKFGGGRTTGFATIYDSVDLRKKYDSKKMLRRDGYLIRAKSSRKQRKEIKGRVLKVRGIAKAKAASSGGKKK